MFKFKFLLLLLIVTVDNVAAEADFSDTEICTDPTKNNCDANAKCNKVVAGVNVDECSPKYFCECNEGYSGDGTKGNCQKVIDAVCAANCDFTKRSLCNYEGTGEEKKSVNFLIWKNKGKTADEADTTMDNFYYVVLDANYAAAHNWIVVDFGRLNLTDLIKETNVRLTVRINSPDGRVLADSQQLIPFHYTVRGWHIVTATIPAKATQFRARIHGTGPSVSHLGIRKIEVEGNC